MNTQACLIFFKCLQLKGFRVNVEYSFCVLQTLNEELHPTLQKLREEKAIFCQYQKIQRKVESFKKLLIAYKFTVESKKAGSGKEKLQKLQTEMEEIQQKVINKHNDVFDNLFSF